MSKYGWTKGAALGANESGILNPLRVQVEKRRKKADADGGGWAEPGSKGKIIGGKRKEEGGKFGTMSEVIVLQNMLENMPDLEVEIADGLGQEIGGECGEKVRIYSLPFLSPFSSLTFHLLSIQGIWTAELIHAYSMDESRDYILTSRPAKSLSSSQIRCLPYE